MSEIVQQYRSTPELLPRGAERAGTGSSVAKLRSTFSSLTPASAAVTLLMLALLAYCVYRTLVVSRLGGLGPDGGYFIVRSWQVAEGQVPYRDFYWWHTPLFLYIHRFFSLFFAETFEGVRLHLLMQHLAGIVLCLAVVRKLLRAPLAVLALVGAVYVASLENLEGFYYMMEPYLNLFTWLAILLALHGAGREESRKGRVLIIAAGIAAGAAFWTKQNGAIVVLLVAALPSLHAGRLRIRPALLALAGSAVLPVAFFALHPSALLPAISMLVVDFGRYASSADKHAERFPLSSIAYSLYLLVPIVIGLLRSVAWAAAADTAERSRGRIGIALMLCGLLFYFPITQKPYAHYLLCALPFTALGLAASLRMPRTAPKVILVPIVAVLVLGFYQGRERLARTLSAHGNPYNVRAAEEEIAAFIRRHAGDARAVYIAPNVPQYYVHIRTPGIDGDYLYLPEDARVLESLRSGVPAFLVDRGNAPIPHYEQVFRSGGYEFVERAGNVSAWRRPSPAGAPGAQAGPQAPPPGG